MARYTPKQRPLAAGGGPARPIKKLKSAKPRVSKPVKRKPAKPGAFACPVCGKAFRTEEALATHKLDAHDEAVDPSTMATLTPGMVRCPECGAPVRKRNLPHHLRFVHSQL